MALTPVEGKEGKGKEGSMVGQRENLGCIATTTSVYSSETYRARRAFTVVPSWEETARLYTPL